MKTCLGLTDELELKVTEIEEQARFCLLCNYGQIFYSTNPKAKLSSRENYFYHLNHLLKVPHSILKDHLFCFVPYGQQFSDVVSAPFLDTQPSLITYKSCSSAPSTKQQSPKVGTGRIINSDWYIFNWTTFNNIYYFKSDITIFYLHLTKQINNFEKKRNYSVEI